MLRALPRCVGIGRVLRGLSRERVRQEFLKLLVAVSALPVIEDAEAEGILSEILGFPLETEAFALALGFARNEI